VNKIGILLWLYGPGKFPGLSRNGPLDFKGLENEIIKFHDRFCMTRLNPEIAIV